NPFGSESTVKPDKDDIKSGTKTDAKSKHTTHHSHHTHKSTTKPSTTGKSGRDSAVDFTSTNKGLSSKASSKAKTTNKSSTSSGSTGSSSGSGSSSSSSKQSGVAKAPQVLVTSIADMVIPLTEPKCCGFQVVREEPVVLPLALPLGVDHLHHGAVAMETTSSRTLLPTSTNASRRTLLPTTFFSIASRPIQCLMEE
ncbi:hypothetical protein Ocin01_08934, partial [Orchesella cincta]